MSNHTRDDTRHRSRTSLVCRWLEVSRLGVEVHTVLSQVNDDCILFRLSLIIDTPDDFSRPNINLVNNRLCSTVCHSSLPPINSKSKIRGKHRPVLRV